MRRATLAGLQVRPHVAFDDAFVARLSVQAFGPYAQNPVAVVSAMIDEADATFVATVDGEAVGFAVLRLVRRNRPFGPWASPATGHLDAIAVARQLQKRGVGSALMDQVETTASAGGAVGMFLLTAARNGPARSLFEASGYQYLAGYAGAYLGRHAGVVMTKALATLA
jgi:ribosomal protein S18 acetylase RimI-like enzyme